MTEKTITIDNSDGGVSSVTVEQTAAPGVEVGGMRINTDLPWYVDSLLLLMFAALVYIGKKYIDKLFARAKNEDS